MSRKPKPKISDFEKAFSELENIVERMELGDQSLETTLKDFERGMELAKVCRLSLDEAEHKVQTLVAKHGSASDEQTGQDDE